MAKTTTYDDDPSVEEPKQGPADSIGGRGLDSDDESSRSSDNSEEDEEPEEPAGEDEDTEDEEQEDERPAESELTNAQAVLPPRSEGQGRTNWTGSTVEVRRNLRKSGTTDGMDGNQVSSSDQSTILTEDQEEYLLKEPKVVADITEKLKVFVAKNIFPKGKFPLGEQKEKKVCRMAHQERAVLLPEGASKEVFASMYYKVVREKLKLLRQNAHASAKWKFESEF